MIYANLNNEQQLNVLNQVNADYENMQSSMIYGQSVPFDELLIEMRQLNDRIRQLPYRKP